MAESPVMFDACCSPMRVSSVTSSGRRLNIETLREAMRIGMERFRRIPVAPSVADPMGAMVELQLIDDAPVQVAVAAMPGPMASPAPAAPAAAVAPVAPVAPVTYTPVREEVHQEEGELVGV